MPNTKPPRLSILEYGPDRGDHALRGQDPRRSPPHRICDETGVAKKTKQFTGSYDDAVQYVVAKLAHRNLTESQKVYAR